MNWPFAAAWTFCTLLGWLLALAATPTPAPGPADPDRISWLLLTASFAQFVTIAWRMRLIAKRPLPAVTRPVESSTGSQSSAFETRDPEITWALCWLSQIYVMASLWLSADFSTVVALGSGTLVLETLLWPAAPRAWHEFVRWSGSPPQAITLPQPLGSEERDAVESEMIEGDIEEVEEEHAAANLSATFYGQTEDGRSYLHGWRRYEMASGQKSLAVTVGFFPPFLAPPQCELDLEGEPEVSCEVEHLTLAGARILLKRRQAQNPATGTVHWHCS